MSAPSASPLLEVRKLTLRFGGLTAVSEVDLTVNEGDIAAVIGPNGAGKTSLFNAMTGIYEPTSGEVLLGGQDVREPMTRRHLIQQGLAGLLLGTMALLATANIDTMWLAVVKNRAEPGFSAGAMATEAWRYLEAQPRVEARMGRFFVVSSDGKATLGTAKTRDEAMALRDAAPASPEQGKARWLRLLALVVGTAVGVAAARAVWKRTRRTPTSLARRGVARTFQNIRLFHNMTVLENVLVAMDRHLSHTQPWTHPSRRLDTLLPLGLLGTLLALVATLRLGGPVGALPTLLLGVFLLGTMAYLTRVGLRGAFSQAALHIESAASAEALELLTFVGLAQHANALSRNLPYGHQRRLEIARALATRPRLLLLDEPAAGMNPSETVDLMQLIRQIRERGVTVLLIEHHMRVVMGISDRITVLVHGKRIAEGTAEEIRNNPQVIEAYLGTDGEH